MPFATSFSRVVPIKKFLRLSERTVRFHRRDCICFLRPLLYSRQTPADRFVMPKRWRNEKIVHNLSLSGLDLRVVHDAWADSHSRTATLEANQ